MRALPAGARVLDLACGGGRDSAALISHGFDVYSTYGSPAMTARASERLQRPVKVMRFDELADIGIYDAVWANASLLHVPRPALEGVLTRVLHASKPGGLHVASYKSGDADGRDAFGRYFNYPDRRSLLAAYTGSGSWQVTAINDYVGTDYGGGERPWIVVEARRPAN